MGTRLSLDQDRSPLDWLPRDDENLARRCPGRHSLVGDLDQDGKVLVTSNDEEGTNIGFPSDQSGREHFRSMLEKTSIRLTPMDINTLVDALNRTNNDCVALLACQQ